MKENFKYIATLSAVAISSFLKINLLGAFSTVFLVVVEFILLTRNIDAGHSGHAGAAPFLVMVFLARPVGSILWLITCFASPFLFFTLGNQYIISKLANRLILDKSESIISPVLDKILSVIQKKQPQVMRNTGDFTLNKLKVINAIRNDKSENKWLKKIIIFGMQKIKMDDIDFNQENLNFYEIIKIKTIQSLNELSEPSRNLIWLTLGIQWLIFLFIWLVK
ncbi:hypothetical protein VUJ46_01730 [Chryseobacterium sp. MYb264]|uniref:hypothetical protein n=1 Tax=Chryseobacterium sp. MYb264 TaxID=2745153 RepID=UPI002E13C927|nr:hypothetical protein VUJ46_01730 [Chryseobacterium sp. MYb264]